MTTKTIESNLADVLYVHEWETTACKCGWKPNGDFDHVDHVAKMLTLEFTVARKA